MTKRPSETQNYENYWKLTVEYTDIHGYRFIETLDIIVRFIDNHPQIIKEYDKKLYEKLQKEIDTVFPKKDKGSVRKSINQFIKLGFINPGLKGYKDETLDFLKATTNRERDLIFSEVYYKYASFNSSVKYDNRGDKHINFLLKTLMHKPNQTLNRNEIIGLITTDVSLHKRGYLHEEELKQITRKSQVTKFEDRKYNQINYFYNFLRYIPGIKIAKNKSTIEYIEDDYLHIKDYVKITRDKTLYRIMKERVKDESMSIYGDIVCYYTKIPMKGLVVSHIVPSQKLLDDGKIFEAYDPNNALLLEPNIDAYFDKFDITFDIVTGTGIFSKKIDNRIVRRYSGKHLDKVILNNDRNNYLLFHNKTFIDKQ